MVRKLLRLLQQSLTLLLLVLPAGLLGTLLALGWSPPGRVSLARLAEVMISQQLDGEIRIGRISGSLLSNLDLENVAILDQLERPVITAERLRASFLLPDLLGGRFLLRKVHLVGASVHLVRTRAGRWNYEDVFRSGLDQSLPHSAPPLVDLQDVTLEGVTLRIDTPTEPESPPEPVSRNATPPALPRIETGDDGGPIMVYQIERISAHLSRLRISTPADDPISAAITTLQAEVEYPALRIVDLHGLITTAGDSLSFDLQRAALPATRVSGSGMVRWPKGPLLFDFSLVADTVDLKDLRWISPDFPDWQGVGRVVAHSLNERRTDYRLTQLSLGSGSAQATGRMTAIVDTLRGLGFEDLSLTLSRVPLTVARPYLDTLPLQGTLDGRITASGFLDTLRLDGDLNFADALVDGMPRSSLTVAGTLHFDPLRGISFQDFRLTRSVLDLGTVGRLVPAVVLPGTLSLDGRVNGPWAEATFTGEAQHLAPDQSLTRMMGRVQLDVRDSILGVDLDVDLDPLSFAALRSGYPEIKARGGLAGHLELKGKLDRMLVKGDLTGEVGTIQMDGHLGVRDDTLLADSLALRIYSLDLDALLGRYGKTSLSGSALLSGRRDPVSQLQGELVLGLDRSRMGEFPIEAVQARIRADSGIAMIDTLRVDLPEGWVDVEGDIGLNQGNAGTLLIDTGFLTLAPWDSILRAHYRITPDTLGPRKLGGTVHGSFRVTGSVDDPRVTGSAQVRNLVFDRWRMARSVATVRADSLGWRSLALTMDADSLGQGINLAEKVSLDLNGRMDSLQINLAGRFRKAGFNAQAHWRQQDSTSGQGQIDSLGLKLSTQEWSLRRPAGIAWNNGQVEISDSLVMTTGDGQGKLVAGGKIPATSPGDISLSLLGLDLRELSALQREHGSQSGLAALDLRLRGTAAAPILSGSAALTAATFDQLRLPLIRTEFNYQDRLFQSRITFWKTGDPLLQADMSLPLDLAFSPRGKRKIPGEVKITAQAATNDLSLLSSFDPTLGQASGGLDLNFKASGSWDEPRLEGSARVTNGSLNLPELGVQYHGLQAWVRFSGDSVIADTIRFRSDGGNLYLRGNVRLVEFTRPLLDLNLRTTTDFLLVDIPGFMTVRPAGEVRLTGPLLQPVLTGSVAVANSQVYYTDIVSKTLLDLSDPLIADLVDTSAIRRLGLQRSFQNRFLDSLRIRDMQLRVAEDVWLRSAEANIMVASDGEARITKNGRDYTVTGSFDAVRGTYDLTMAYALAKTFNIEHGTVSFFGTPDLNGTLNLQASRKIRTDSGEEIPLVATITGTILTPEIALTSPGRNLSNTDAFAYLFTGAAGSDFGVGENARNRFLGNTATSFISSAASQAFSKQLGVGVNVNLLSTNEYGLGLSQQLGDQAFISLSGDVCGGQSTWAAMLEYALPADLRLQVSRKPVRTCDATRTSTDYSAKYQFGADLIWRREY